MASEAEGDLLPSRPAPKGAPLRVVRCRWHLMILCGKCRRIVGQLYKRSVRSWFKPWCCQCGECHVYEMDGSDRPEIEAWALSHLREQGGTPYPETSVHDYDGVGAEGSRDDPTASPSGGWDPEKGVFR